jgi:hypothetical protein
MELPCALPVPAYTLHRAGASGTTPATTAGSVKGSADGPTQCSQRWRCWRWRWEPAWPGVASLRRRRGRKLLATDKKLATKVSVTSTTGAGTKHTALKRLTLKAKATTGAKHTKKK